MVFPFFGIIIIMKANVSVVRVRSGAGVKARCIDIEIEIVIEIEIEKTKRPIDQNGYGKQRAVAIKCVLDRMDMDMHIAVTAICFSEYCSMIIIV